MLAQLLDSFRSFEISIVADCALNCREAMEKLVDDGLVKHLGVSNFNAKQVEDVLEYARIKPVMNQVELHPLLAQRKLVGVCARKVSLSAVMLLWQKS